MHPKYILAIYHSSYMIGSKYKLQNGFKIGEDICERVHSLLKSKAMFNQMTRVKTQLKDKVKISSLKPSNKRPLREV